MKRRRLETLLLLGAAACGGGNGGPGPGPTPSQVLASAGENQVGVAGQALPAPLEVTVKDASGNPMANVTVNWAVASGGGSVTPSSNTTGADGKATASRTLGAGAGTQTTTATVSGVTPTTFHHVAQIQGATQIAANVALTRSDSVLSTVPFSVVVRDQNNQPVAGVTVNWSLNGTNGTLSQTVATTNASGIASTDLVLTQTMAPIGVLATVTGLQGSPVQFIENAVAGNATQMALDGGNFQAAPVSSALAVPLSVKVQDAYGNPKQGVTVTWAVFGGGSALPASPVTNASGIAQVTRTLGASPGAYGDTASVTGLTGSPVGFSDTAVAVTEVQVGSGGLKFAPDSAIAPAGAFVRFTWASGTHNVTYDSGPSQFPSSETIATGTFLVRLGPASGKYVYHCTLHGSATSGMRGTITVN